MSNKDKQAIQEKLAPAVTLDLSKEMIARIDEVARENGLSRAAVTNLVVQKGLVLVEEQLQLSESRGVR